MNIYHSDTMRSEIQSFFNPAPGLAAQAPKRLCRRHVYDVMSESIRNDILEGRLPPGTALLSITDLAEQFGISEISVRAGLRSLVRDGFIVAKRRSGTYVAPRELWDRHLRNYIPYEERIVPMRLMASGVVRLTLPWYREACRRGMLAELEPWLGRAGARIDPDAFFPELLSACRYAGKLYGLPAGFSTLALFYNKDWLHRAKIDVPGTWQELLAVQRKLSERGRDGHIYRRGCCAGPWPLWIWQAGGDVFDFSTGRCAMDTAEARAGLDFFCNMSDMGADSLTGLPFWNEEPFLEQRSAMTFSTRSLLQRLRVKDRFRWGTAPLPRGKHPANWCFASVLAVLNEERDKPSAIMTLKNLLSFKAQCAEADFAQHYPSRLDAAEKLLNRAAPTANGRLFLEALPSARFLVTPQPHFMRLVETRIIHHLVTYHKTHGLAALPELVAALNKEIAKNAAI